MRNASASYGWSYGGYMTVMSMLRRPDLFKVGVSGAPVSDWDGYDTGYTERYMGTPQNNAEGYREGSLLTSRRQACGSTAAHSRRASTRTFTSVIRQD